MGFDLEAATIDTSFTVFVEQDSGCLSYGVEHDGRRWFVKRGTTLESRRSLARAVAFHAVVRHDVIVAPHSVLGDQEDLVLVYPWYEGVVLNHATVRGAARAGLARFQSLPREQVVAALTDILDAHVAVAVAGMVAIDLYDGCLLYDFPGRRMRLIDLDEYRPGPFVVEGERLPGSSRYMAPEEFVQGEMIDERSTVFTLGRTIWNLFARLGPQRRSATVKEEILAVTLLQYLCREQVSSVAVEECAGGTARSRCSGASRSAAKPVIHTTPGPPGNHATSAKNGGPKSHPARPRYRAAATQPRQRSPSRRQPHTVTAPAAGVTPV